MYKRQIEFLSDSAVQILAARERALCVYSQVKATSGDKRRAWRVMNAAVCAMSIDTPKGTQQPVSYTHLLALLRVGTAASARGCGAFSLRTYFYCLRALIRWMSEIGITRFADLDEAAMAALKQVITQRRGYVARTVSRETLRHHYHVLISLYRHRGRVRDAFQVHPFPGLTPVSYTHLQRVRTAYVTTYHQISVGMTSQNSCGSFDPE